MGKMSAAKGSSFERDNCRRLSRWVSLGKDEDIFWRTAGSGARAEVASKKGRVFAEHAGDIAAVKPEGIPLLELVFLECKHVKDLQLANTLVGRPSELEKHFLKAERQASAHLKIPWCIVRQNRFPTLFIGSTLGIQFEPFAHSRLATVFPRQSLEMEVFDFEKFLVTVSAEYFIEAMRSVRQRRTEFMLD